MKTLLILRHAKSAWDEPGVADHDRPLSKRGKRDAPRMGQLLRDEELVPDLILSSTAKRARRTAQLVAETCGYEGDIELDESLYLADPEAYLEALADLPDAVQRVMVVGHNPGLEELLEALTGEAEPLPTAALAEVALSIAHWGQAKAAQGQLVNVWLPREREA
jgi:phosphohistidine phosphatase